jgi:hypothetical protein
MAKSRLFHTLVIVGASLTGVAAPTAVVATTAVLAGCDDDQEPIGIIDMGIPSGDLSKAPDLSHPG